MNKYTIYLKSNKKIKVVADEWALNDDFIVFTKDYANIYWMRFAELVALKKEVI